MTRAHSQGRPTGRPTNADIYDRVTARIIAAMESGTVPWAKPWNGVALSAPANAVTRRAYHGCNVLALMCEAWEKGYRSSLWLTFQQAVTHGVVVRKGEKGTPVYYMSKATRKERADDGSEDVRAIFFAKLYYVFNVDQCGDLVDGSGCLAKLRGPEPERDEWDAIAECERVVEATGAKIVTGAQASYSPLVDTVTMPPRESFPNGAATYYPVLFHELSHWTGNASRLNRDLNAGPFGSPTYAFEELIAELGAAFLSQRAGLDHVSQASNYLAHWLEAVREKGSAIVTAARLAQQAADFVWPIANDDDPNAPDGVGESVAEGVAA